jgi:hypothetical protein
MKRPIFFAVIRARFMRNRRGYYEVLEVTTEKGRQVYGRDADGAATHVSIRDVLKRCTSRPEADEILRRAEEVKTRHRAGIDAARRALADAEGFERRELEALVR